MEDILDIQENNGAPIDGPSLDQIAREGYTFDFSKYFDTGWKAMKDDVGQYIIYALVAGIIFLVSIFTIIGALLIAMPLLAGYIAYGSKVLRGEQREFNDFFNGFKSFGPLLGYMGILILVGLIALIPFAVIFGMNLSALESMGASEIDTMVATTMLPLQLSYGIFSIALQSVLILAVPFIVVGQLGAIDAIKWSIKITTKNFWWFLLYTFMVNMVGQAGLITCCIGVLFTIPLGQCLTLGAYAEIVGLGDKREFPV